MPGTVAHRTPSIPFFATVATLGDAIEYAAVNGGLRFVGVLARSGNSLIRVYYGEEANAEALSIGLLELGCELERDQVHALVAVSIPPSASLAAVQA